MRSGPGVPKTRTVGEFNRKVQAHPRHEYRSPAASGSVSRFPPAVATNHPLREPDHGFAFQWNYGGRRRFITVDPKDAPERAAQVERSHASIASTWDLRPSGIHCRRRRASPIIGGHRMIASRARTIGLPQDRRWNRDRSTARVVRAERRCRPERSRLRRLPLA